MRQFIRAIVASGLACALAASTVSALANEGDGLTVRRFDAWSLEVVGNGGRAACSVIAGERETPSAVITKTDDSELVVPVFNVAAKSGAFVEGPVAIFVDKAALGPAIIEQGYGDGGAFIAAYPAIAVAEAIIAAMRKGEEVRLVHDGTSLLIVPLKGFAAAWGELRLACGD